MYNTDIPSRSELPSTKQLIRSTLIAVIAAAALLVTTVLPAEYGIDPTGIGRLLGLTEMGEIKEQLSKEAEADRKRDKEMNAPSDKKSTLIGNLLAQFVIGSAAAQTPIVIAQVPRTDEMSVTLAPGESAEIKLDMKKGAKATYSWKATGGVVNHDTHGEPHNNPNATHSYKKGRGLASDEGVLQAAFDGQHGWFWRNRSAGSVTVTVKASGEYTSMKKML
jgi:hypothetical protein